MYQVQDVQTSVEKHFRLSMEHARRLSHLAHARGIDEDQVVEKALDILLSLSDFLDERAERQGWSVLAEASLQRAWDNDADANYDHWRTLYDVQSR